MEKVTNALVFCNRKRDVDIVFKSLQRHGFSVARLHGDMIQSLRMETLTKFKENKIQLLVCSDVAARGLDIKGVSHVFNFDVPTNADDYTHRIGRTGRAGAKGHAFTISTLFEIKYIQSIEKNIGKVIPRYISNDTIIQSTEKNKKTSTRATKEDTSPHKRTLSKKKFTANHAKPTLEKELNEPTIELGDHVPAFLLKTNN